MAIHDDDVVMLDSTGITVKNYFLPGRARHISYDDIVTAELIPLGFGTGLHQLVGIGPLRPRLFFHWDRKRAGKSHGLSLDLGRRLRVVITLDDPGEVLAQLNSRIGAKPDRHR